MRPQSRPRFFDGDEIGVRNPDRAIAALAARQRGVVSHDQLVAAGIGDGAIKRRLRAGRLHPVHRGVYLVGHPKPMQGAREIAAVLACGSGAVVSHRSAANLWRVLPYPPHPGPIDITVRGRKPDSRSGLRIHCVKGLDRRDVRRVGGIPITSPARTLFDLAAVVSTSELERALAEAQVLRVVRPQDLVDQAERNQGRRGVRAFRAAVELPGAPPITRSEAERRFLRLVRAAGLPPPQVNARAGGYEVDFLWRGQRLVVEVDGYAYHANRRAFERDRERDAALAAAGYTVLRVTWRQLVNEPAAVVARLAAALALRGRSPE
jgi:very-short-patch-repair endonuclease